MKRILIVCLLGMGLLLPSTTITAKEFSAKRIVDIFMEDDWLQATSDGYTGSIVKVEVFNSSEQKVLGESCRGFSCEVYIGGLPSGSYTAWVTTSLTTYSEGFVVY